jgi:hypothetical protein
MIYNPDMEIVGATTAGASVGALQTFLLRQFVDNKMAESFFKNTSSTPPLLMKQLKGFGSASALAGIIGGVVGLTVGLAALLKGKLIRSRVVAGALVGYGTTALITGALSGAMPTPAWTNAVAADPNNPVTKGSARRQQVVITSNGVASGTSDRVLSA